MQLYGLSGAIWSTHSSHHSLAILRATAFYCAHCAEAGEYVVLYGIMIYKSLGTGAGTGSIR